MDKNKIIAIFAVVGCAILTVSQVGTIHYYSGVVDEHNTRVANLEQLTSDLEGRNDQLVLNIEQQKNSSDFLKLELETQQNRTVELETQIVRNNQYIAKLQDELNVAVNALPSNSVVENVPLLDASLSGYNVYSYYGGVNGSVSDNGFLIPYPENISSGNFSGSDAVSFHNFTCSRFEFDALFNFTGVAFADAACNEMVVLLTNNIVSYKGLEFGVAAWAYDGSIVGYIQDGLGYDALVHFQTVALCANDNLMHHYTVNVTKSGGETVFAFGVDGLHVADIHYVSSVGSSYVDAKFHVVCACHRTTSDWVSVGSFMLVGNFTAFDA